MCLTDSSGLKAHRPVSTLLKALLLSALALAGAAAAASETPTQPSPQKGRIVFQNKGCGTCHAVYGQGGGQAPDLGYRQFYGTHLQLAALMWNHFPRMRAKMEETGFQFPELEQEEMTQLISYLSFIRYLGAPGREFKGRRLLRSKGCISCHKFGGAGGNLGPDISALEEYLSPLRLAESMWNHGPKLLEAFQQRRIQWPRFQGNEFVDLAAGIRSFMSPTRVTQEAFEMGDPEKGKTMATQKGCMKCHSFQDEGGTLGPDFAQVDFSYSVTRIAGEMWNHGPPMWEAMQARNIAFPTFEKGEMGDVIAYLYGLKLTDAPGNSDEGLRLVKEKGCLSCHSIRGTGSTVSKDFAEIESLDSPEAMISAMWNHAPHMHRKLKEKKMKWPELEARELAHLYAFLQSLSQ